MENVNSVVISMSSRLEFSNIQADNGGMYTCVVINEAGFGTMSASVYVNPNITDHTDEMFLSPGQRLELSCVQSLTLTPHTTGRR